MALVFAEIKRVFFVRAHRQKLIAAILRDSATKASIRGGSSSTRSSTAVFFDSQPGMSVFNRCWAERQGWAVLFNPKETEK
jgi:hypothetical protein